MQKIRMYHYSCGWVSDFFDTFMSIHMLKNNRKIPSQLVLKLQYSSYDSINNGENVRRNRFRQIKKIKSIMLLEMDRFWFLFLFYLNC